MGSRGSETTLQETASGSQQTIEVRKTVRRLIHQVTNSFPISALQDQKPDTQAVLVDEEVDGVRYRLLRSQPKPQQLQLLLSPREKEIARMVAKGHPNKVIAAVLDISPWTVSTHLRRIFAKLGVGSRAAMVAQLIEEGLLSESSSSVELAVLQHRRL